MRKKKQSRFEQEVRSYSTSQLKDMLEANVELGDHRTGWNNGRSTRTFRIDAAVIRAELRRRRPRTPSEQIEMNFSRRDPEKKRLRKNHRKWFAQMSDHHVQTEVNQLKARGPAGRGASFHRQYVQAARAELRRRRLRYKKFNEAMNADRDASPEKGWDVLQYSSGKSYVEASSYGRPMYRSKREAEQAAHGLNARWEGAGRQSQMSQLRGFFAPASRDRATKHHGRNPSTPERIQVRRTKRTQGRGIRWHVYWGRQHMMAFGNEKDANDYARQLKRATPQ